MKDSIEPLSFSLGMATAFCECVAAGCKPCALSHPIPTEQIAVQREPLEAVVREHGLRCWLEESADLPEGERLCWWVIYRDEEILIKYRELRKNGLHPIKDLRPFHAVLGYQER